MNKQSFSSNKHSDISIILPVFNEGKNIAKQLEHIENAIEIKHEVLVVYDLDRDNTVPVVKVLQKKYSNIKLIKNIYRKGVISAVKTGFKKASGRYLVVMPADLADNPHTINKMYKKIQHGYDIVGATRYSIGGKKIGGGFVKTTLSRIAGLFTPFLLGIPVTDISNGFKMYSKSVLNKIKLTADGGWEFSLELVIKAHLTGFKISEVPSVWRDRASGKSKFKLLKWLPKYLRWYLWGIYKRFIF